MKFSCHFFYNHLGIPNQFSNSNSPVSVLHGTNLYSLISSIYFHSSSLSVSWQRIYNTFSLDKSSNHTLSLQMPTSTTNFPWPFPSANCLTVLLGTLLYSRGTVTHHRKHVTWPLLLCDVTANHRKHMSRDPYTLLCDVTAHALYINGPFADTKKHFHSTVARRVCWNVLTRLPPSSAFGKSVTLYIFTIPCGTLSHLSRNPRVSGNPGWERLL
jgi:hypothetical protein